MSKKDLVSIPAKELRIINVVAKGLQQAVDRVLNRNTLDALKPPGRGVSCFVYPEPLGAALGSVTLCAGAAIQGQEAAALTLSLSRGAQYVPDMVLECLKFRLEASDHVLRLRRNPDQHIMELRIHLPLNYFKQHPRLWVGGQASLSIADQRGLAVSVTEQPPAVGRPARRIQDVRTDLL